MDLRTKFVFALVAVALGSMLALGGVTYGRVSGMLERTALAQLEAIAESRQESVERLVAGWHERVRLVASRTQLRLSLREHDRSRNPATATRIRQILADALNATNTVESLMVFDGAGSLVASVARSSDGDPVRTPPPAPPPGVLSEFRGLVFGPASQVRLVFVASLESEGARLGVLRATLSGAELINLVRNHNGMGETGEAMIVARDDDGGVRVIHPVRRQNDQATPPSVDAWDPATLALAGVGSRRVERAIDYSGHPVRAVSRLLPEVGWTLVVKRDEDELRAPVVAFRRELTQLGITFSAFAILLGTFLGLAFAKPIHELAGVARRIGGGDLGARAPVAREDEIGLLARTFNEMAAELERQVSELREYRRYFDLSRDMLCIAGMDGYFKRTNPAFQRVLGWTPEQLVSRPFYDLVHPDDLEATKREVAKLAEGVPTIRFENRYRRADGRYRYLLWTAHPEPESGLLYSAARDITELKQAQAQLETVIATMPAAILGVASAGAITSANPAADRLLGYESGTLIGLPIERILPGDGSGSPFDVMLAESLQRPASAGRECPARRRDGSAIVVEVRLHPTGDGAGTETLVSLVDQTALLQARREIDVLARELEVTRARLRADA